MNKYGLLGFCPLLMGHSQDPLLSQRFGLPHRLVSPQAVLWLRLDIEHATPAIRDGLPDH